MSPAIDNRDKLIIEHWSGEQIQDNKIYVFCFNNEFFVKRLSKNLDEIIIKSDNPEYRIRTISKKNSRRTYFDRQSYLFNKISVIKIFQRIKFIKI